MNTAVSNVTENALSATEMSAHVQRIQQVMKKVMKRDVHYGKIPGTPKPTLYKPGAETLCVTFHIAPTYAVEDLSNADEVRYRVTCRGTHHMSGTILGEGMGEASTNEEKYKWRSAVCPEEFDETLDDRRRVKWRKGSDGRQPYSVKMVRTEPADLANTVLKMACKRAQVAMAINVTGASDIFAQDLEDGGAGGDTGGGDTSGGDGGGGASGGGGQQRSTAKPTTNQPQGTSGSKKLATEKQLGLLRGKMSEHEVAAQELCEHFGIPGLEDLPFDKVDAALTFIQRGRQ